MIWFIASDIHGSAYWCRKMLEAFEREKADRILLLGDVLYHGPRNDLPEEYAPKKVIEMLKDKRNIILGVRGNCEAEIDEVVLGFPLMADYTILILDDLFPQFAGLIDREGSRGTPDRHGAAAQAYSQHEQQHQPCSQYSVCLFFAHHLSPAHER